MVFWGGDVRLLDSFPYITWDVHEHLTDYDEAMQALPLIKAGDIGLHRDCGYLSNLAIPGFMKHAWVHIDSPITSGIRTAENLEGIAHDTTKMQIVEAISEGVVKRHALFPIRSDYVIILRPKDATQDEINKAVRNANKIVGCRYDASFKFDIEDELKMLGTRGPGDLLKTAEDKLELDRIRTNTIAEWDGGFSCTETASFAWWHKRRKLQLFRTTARGKQVILADQFINDGFEIIWMSDSITEEVATLYGLGEEGLELIKEYRMKSPVNCQSGTT
jgi:hypothetical protein